MALLQAEGQNAQPDMVITVDISCVKELADSGLLVQLSSPVIARNKPAYLRAEPEWQGRVCTRKGSHEYDRALLASLIAHHGEEGAHAWAKKVWLVIWRAARKEMNGRKLRLFMLVSVM